MRSAGGAFYFIGLPFLITLFQGCQIIPDRITPPWGIPTLIVSDNKTGAAFFAPIALDNAGNGIVVWVQSDGTSPSIWADRYEMERGWGTSTLIETNTGTAADPHIAMDGRGNAIVVWQQYASDHWSIYANRYEVVRGWGIAIAIAPGSAEVSSPQLAADTAGNAIAVWREFDGSSHHIYANRYDAGTGWEMAAPIGTNEGTALDTQIAMDGDGNAMVVWSQWDGSHHQLWMNRYEGENGWGVASLIAASTEDAISPRLATSNTGSAMVVWRQFEGEEYSLYASHYDPAKGWEKADLIETHRDEAIYPRVVMDRHGNTIVVWMQRRCIKRDCVYYNVWTNHYRAGKGWGTAVQLAKKAYDPYVVFDGRGNAMAVWSHYDWRRASIWANRYEVGAGWQKATRISSYAGNVIEHPVIALNEIGDAIATWDQFSEGTRYIWANRYEAVPADPILPH